jgi:hypothetical protein
VVVVKSERDMKEMMRSLGKYVMKKKLEVNVEKTTMLVFNKRKRKSDENEWKWEGRKIERVQQGVREVHDRGDSGVPGERECKREKEREMMMWERGERKQVLDGRREKKVQDVL